MEDNNPLAAALGECDLDELTAEKRPSEDTLPSFRLQLAFQYLLFKSLTRRRVKCRFTITMLM